MALSNVSIHRIVCIFVPIDNPKTAELKQSKIADTYNWMEKSARNIDEWFATVSEGSEFAHWERNHVTM